MRRPRRDQAVEHGSGARVVRGVCAWFFIQQGDVGPDKRRRAIWCRDGDATYYVCPCCRAVNALDIGSCVIDGRDLDTIDCNVCEVCHAHLWFTLLGWTLRRVHGAIKARPDRCPLCSKSAQILSSRYSFCRCAPGGGITWRRR